jgi:glutamate synthase domain-containing protein 3
MSGGIAYVLDEHGQFAKFRCNKASVDLEPIVEAEDDAILRNLIQRHLDLTGSPRARRILDDWAAMLPKFVKVFPHEFRKALARQKAKAAELKFVQAVPIEGQPVLQQVHG